MNIFDFEDYRKFVAQKIQGMPKRGYGQYRKMAEFLGVSTVMVSQIFKGDRLLPIEQAYELTKYFGLTGLESRYFLLLVQLSRAGTQPYKQHLKKELAEIKEKSKDLKTRLSADKELSEEAKAIFYSDWIYSGIRLLTSIEGCSSLEAIAQRFDMPPQKVRSILEFLLRHGLCVQQKDKIQMGPSRTHLEANSPHIKSRQISWRLKGFEKMNLDSEDLFYTAPMALSKKVKAEVRKELILLIQKVNQIVPPSKSEELACLNIDWFQF